MNEEIKANEKIYWKASNLDDRQLMEWLDRACSTGKIKELQELIETFAKENNYIGL